MNQDGKGGSAKNYQTTVESLKRFVRREVLYISEITYSFMKDYEAYLKNAPSLSKKEER
ncbi:MAG: phage integrase SAM-like domain-containing protein [Parabacteroides gordonii]|nr:phage integrase SAM-like domain-containing protein [Parabacteroides gordonii]